MQVGGPIPFTAARAYGIARPVAPVKPVQPAAPAPETGSAPREASARVDALVAGRVPGQVNFETAQSGVDRVPDRLALYTRAADRIEAATGIELGRSLDVRG